MIDLESASVRAIMSAAHELGGMKPRRNISGAYGHAATRLLERARIFSGKSDKQWAAEVAMLKDAMKKACNQLLEGPYGNHEEVREVARGLTASPEEHDGDA